MRFVEGIELSGLASVLAVGIALLYAARVLRGSAGADDASGGMLRFTGQVLLAVGLLGGSFVVAGELGFFAWLIVMGIWIRAAVHYRAVQRQNLFSALTLAVDSGMPLGPIVAALAREQDGALAQNAQQLAARLDQGVPLADALRESRHMLPREALMAASVGFETGDLNSSLRAIIHANQFDRSALQPVITRSLYLVLIVAYTVFLVSFMEIKIAPSYQKIFSDFSSSTPPIFSIVVQGAAAVAGLGVLLPLVLVGVLVWNWLQWRGTLMPRLPGLRRIIRWVDMAPVLRLLAVAVERERSLVRVLLSIARHHPKHSMRTRVRQVVAEIDNGHGWQESLRRRRLIRPAEEAVLKAAQHTGNLPWALEEMAEAFERRAALRLRAISQMALPLAMIPIGLFIALVGVAYFSPIAKLIQDLS
jgi:type II secretory pathway component PulF